MNEDHTSTGGPGRAEAEASVERFLDAIRADPDRSESTANSYGRALGHLLAVAPVPPGELTDDHIVALRERLDSARSLQSGEPLCPGTVNIMLSATRAYLRWARRPDLIGHPGLRARRDRRDWKRIRRERTLSAEDDATMMASCYEAATTSDDPLEVRDNAFVLFLLATGLRLGEALDLRWRDLDLEAGTVRVWRGKGGRERTALMDPRTIEVMSRLLGTGQGRPRKLPTRIPGLDAWFIGRVRPFGPDDPVFCGAIPGGPMPSGTGKNISVRLCRLYIDRPYTPHCLRHTFCTRFLRHGRTLQDLETLMELAGHSSLFTTQGYLDLDDEIRDERFARMSEAHWENADPRGHGNSAAEEQNEKAPAGAPPTEDAVRAQERAIKDAGRPAAEGERPTTLLDWA